VCESSVLYHSYSNLAKTSGESFVPNVRCRSASYASCSSAYSDPATWCNSGSPAGYSPHFADHLGDVRIASPFQNKTYPIISPIYFLRVGSSLLNNRSNVSSLPLLLESGFSSACLYTSIRKIPKSPPLPPCPALRRDWETLKRMSMAADQFSDLT